MNRHGNNGHPDLPPCPFCGHWAWLTGDTHIGDKIQIFYSCGTPGCLGSATAVTCALVIASVYRRPDVEGEHSVAGFQWLNAALKVLRAGDINNCVYADVEPPAAMVVGVPVPAAEEATLLYGLDEWLVAAPGSLVDLAALFRQRVESAREYQREEDMRRALAKGTADAAMV